MRVLVIHPNLQPPGGGNGVAAWALQALCEVHDVTLLSWRPVELGDVNRFYGTALRPGAFATHVVPAPYRLLDRVPTPLSLLKMHSLWGYARRYVDRFDAVLATQNETDVGRRIVHYVHYPWHDMPRPRVDHRWYHALPVALRAYYRLCIAVSGYRRESMLRNVALTNSRWTARRFEKLYGVPAQALYPPVPGPFVPEPWARRRDAIVSVGRWSPEKRVLETIEIVRRVRALGHALPLHLVGTPGGSRYTRAVRRAAARHRDWVTLHEDIDRSALMRLLGATRFGLHAMVDEHFGIAVAEMAHSGCLPFVHATGGPLEIVGDDALTWRTVDEAVSRIDAVLRDATLQARLREQVTAHAARYTVEAFCRGVREVVERIAADAPAAVSASRTGRSG